LVLIPSLPPHPARHCRAKPPASRLYPTRSPSLLTSAAQMKYLAARFLLQVPLSIAKPELMVPGLSRRSQAREQTSPGRGPSDPATHRGSAWTAVMVLASTTTQSTFDRIFISVAPFARE